MNGAIFTKIMPTKKQGRSRIKAVSLRRDMIIDYKDHISLEENHYLVAMLLASELGRTSKRWHMGRAPVHNYDYCFVQEG